MQAQAHWTAINAENATNPMSSSGGVAQAALGAQGVNVKPFDITASKAPERRGSSV
jgi:hypothetical protein